MSRQKKTIFIVVVPWDYTTADVELFETREEADAFVRSDDVPDKAKNYVTILEREILFR